MEPDTPFYRRWSFLLAGVIGVAAVAALIGLRGFSAADPPPPATTAAPTTTQAPPPTTAPPTSIGPTSKPDEILWEELASRRSTLQSEGFRAPSAWRLEWSVDCSNFADHGGGNFKITGDGDFQQIQIEITKVSDKRTRPISGGGFGHLYVETVCERWTVRALSG